MWQEDQDPPLNYGSVVIAIQGCYIFIFLFYRVERRATMVQQSG